MYVDILNTAIVSAFKCEIWINVLSKIFISSRKGLLWLVFWGLLSRSAMFNYIVTDHIVDRRSTKFNIVHFQSNPDNMKPA